MEKVIDRIEKLMNLREVPSRKQKRVLSETCKISYEAVRQWWTSTNDIGNDHIKAISKKWNANAHWLITGEGSPDSQQINMYTPDDSVDYSNMDAGDFVDRNRSILENMTDVQRMELIAKIAIIKDEIISKRK